MHENSYKNYSYSVKMIKNSLHYHKKQFLVLLKRLYHKSQYTVEVPDCGLAEYIFRNIDRHSNKIALVSVESSVTVSYLRQ